LKISYSFTSGRLETLFKLSNYRQYGSDNNAEYEKAIIDAYREQVVGKKANFEDTNLYRLLSQSEDKIVQNRLARALKENTGSANDDRIGNEYRSGVWHELQEYRMSERFVRAKEALNQKHMVKTGMEITSRDIEAMIGFKSNNIRAVLSHKKAAVMPMIEAIEKFTEQY